MWLENDEDKQSINGQPAQGGDLSIGAGAGSAQAGELPSGVVGNPSTINPIQSNKPTQNFATVQDYLGANKQQGEDLGQKFTSNLTETANKEKGTIDTAIAGAQNDITAGTASYDPNLTSKALANPTSVANDPGQLQSFLKQWNASYRGPTSFETSNQYTPAVTAANEAGQKAAQLGSVGGQQQLLQDQFNVYGQGNKGLDQALLQNSSAYPDVQKAQPAFQSINDYLGQQSAALNPKAQQAKTASETAIANTQGAFTGNLSNFQNKINNEVAAAKEQMGTLGSPIAKDLKSGNSAALETDLKNLGISPENIASVTQYLSALNKDYQQNPDLSNYNLTNPNVDINAGNVATPEEYANAAAYGKLTGEDYSGVLNPANAAQAGTAATKPNVDVTGISNYLKGNLGQRDKELLSGANLIPDLNNIASNADQGTSLAQKYVNMAKRAKADRNSPEMKNLFVNASQQFVKSLGGDPFGGGQAPITNPASAGLLNFVNTLSRYLYGRDSYGGNAPPPLT